MQAREWNFSSERAISTFLQSALLRASAHNFLKTCAIELIGCGNSFAHSKTCEACVWQCSFFLRGSPFPAGVSWPLWILMQSRRVPAAQNIFDRHTNSSGPCPGLKKQ